MMMPALPIANLVVGKPRFAFGALDALFDSMFGLGHPGELRFFRVSTCIGQVVIRFDDAVIVAIFVAYDDQDFLVALLSFLRLRYDAPANHADNEWPFRAIAHVDLGPIRPIERSGPLVAACPRSFRRATETTVSWRVDLQISNLCIGRNGQQVALALIEQSPAKPGGTAHFVVARDPRMWQFIAVLLEHFQAE